MGFRRLPARPALDVDPLPQSVDRLGHDALDLGKYTGFTSVPTLVGTTFSGSALANAGAMAHLAAGGGWKTIYTLANTGSTPGEAKLSFFGDDGKPLALAVSVFSKVTFVPVI